MTGIKDFTDFEAFRQSREFVKQTGKAIRTYRLNRDFRSRTPNAKTVHFRSVEFR